MSFKRAERRSPKTLLALIVMGGSAIYWWGVQSVQADNRAIALAFTAILALAPPSLVSFLTP